VTGVGQERVAYHRQRSRIIDASPDQVWPWLVQMGFDRGGWYAIDRLEELFGVGRFATGGSARRVEPDLQHLAVGDRMPLSRELWLDVVVLDRPRLLELALPPGRLAWTWRFTLRPVGTAVSGEPATSHRVGTTERAARCELTITTELSVPARRLPTRVAARLAFSLFDLGHGLMEHVQLRTLAKRVPGAGPACPGE